MSATIHWLGAGLSSIPGIEKLAHNNHKVIVWNRSLQKAQNALKHITDKIEIKTLEWTSLTNTIAVGDILISMLPATMHIQVAELCLAKKAHFVSSSYISPAMQALHEKAIASSLCFVNEVGLDPGLDHILAHALVNNYKSSEHYNSNNELYFRSYCGGFPKVANDFKYKFSWSPLGVLKALKSPAKWLEQGKVGTSNAPWEALADYSIDLPNGQETFQCYPNRDSLPFIAQYQLNNENVQQFVRGTLRLAGWSTAWAGLFDQVASLTSAACVATAEQALKTISEELERKYSYAEHEPDRVVLHVELVAKKAGKNLWQQSYLLDSCGNEKGQAMARLVSIPVSFAIESVINGTAKVGVSAAPHQTDEVAMWMNKLTDMGEEITLVN